MSNSNQKKNASSSARRKNAAPKRQTKNTKAQAAPPVPEPKPLFSSRVKNDLAGLVIAILAGVLLVLVLLPSDAVGANFISNTLRIIFGQGAVLLPFLLMGWAATFFIRKRLTNSPLRLAIGLGVIYLALITIFGVLTPQIEGDLARIFDAELLKQQGGYVGGAIAWALLSFFGSVATIVILIGMILIGLVLIGLSITGLFDAIIRFFKGLGKKKANEAELKPLSQYGNVSNPSSGGAYQMGPQGASAVPTPSKGKRFATNKGSAAQLQATGLMGAEQLQHTLYQGSDQNAEGATALMHDLGSTRRKIVDNGATNNEMASPTVLLRKQTEHEDDILEADLEKQSGRDKDFSAHLEQDEDKQQALASEQDADKKEKKKTRKQAGTATSTLKVSTNYVLPNAKLLRVSREKTTTKAGSSELRSTAARLQETLEEFKVEGEVVGWIAGPTVTLYKISLGEGVRLNKITALQSDIQLALAAKAVRIVAPIPGTSLVGIEIPNQDRNEVLLGDVLAAARDNALELAIGKDVEGECIVADLATMPHLLIGGTTGSGKSVAINSIIMSILMRTTPEEVRMIMIDPKRVELTLYNGIPHLYVPVVTDAGQAASALAWCVAEMDRRLKLFEKHAVKNIKQFNTRVADNLAKLEQEAAAKGDVADKAEEQAASEAADANTTGELDTSAVKTKLLQEDEELDVTVEQENLRATMPYLVIVIDELADLMMLNGKEVEGAISRLAQLARAAGLHLIVATQRPSTNVITGLIKANIVNRIAFTVASGIDSRVILDSPGAEDLIGLGDMLFSKPEFSKPIRIQGCLVSESEIETVVEYWRGQGTTDYHEEILLASSSSGMSSGGLGGGDSLEDDPLLWEAAEIVVSSQLGSTSTLQRRLKVGYARAGRIMDMLEMKGIVGPPNGSKPREVLIDDVLDLETLRAYG